MKINTIPISAVSQALSLSAFKHIKGFQQLQSSYQPLHFTTGKQRLSNLAKVRTGVSGRKRNIILSVHPLPGEKSGIQEQEPKGWTKALLIRCRDT
jgi:hypothetical protein